MENVNDKIRMLRMFQADPDRYLPVVDHAWKVFPDRDEEEVNIGWDTGLLGENRPYFMECWAICGITMLTYFISADGIGDATVEDLLGMLTGAGLFRLLDPKQPRTSARKFTDENGNVFFSVNVAVGDEEHTYLEGGPVFPLGPLNRYNGKKDGEEKK